MSQSLSEYLTGLEVYPSGNLIDEASNFAQNKAAEYIANIDANAVVTVEEGEVYVKWAIERDEDCFEWEANAQCEFDERFSEKLEEIQQKKSIKPKKKDH
jgi:hypothetical protein